jgi:glycerophosphoryl diester phosphodiesterase
MRHFIPVLTKRTALIGFAASVVFAAHSAQASSFNLTFIGQSVIPTGTQYEGTTVGGLSSITYDATNHSFYTISDDRSQINPARFYKTTINLSDGSLENGDVTFTGVTTLLQPNGQLFDAFSLDPEGIALVNGSTVYVSSEGEVSDSRIINPFVNSFSLASGQQGQALPIPSQFISQPNAIPTANGVRNNMGFESLTVTPDQRYLFTASESALLQDGAEATVSNGSSSRILQYDVATGKAIAQFLYNVEPVPLAPNPSTGINFNGLVELLALDNSGKRFLSLERSYSQGSATPFNTRHTVKLYEFSLEGATDISGYNSIQGISGILPAQKTLLLDLSTLGIPIYNVEGLTFGPNLPNGNRSLILVGDNNFGTSQTTQFLAFEVQAVPELLTILGAAIAVGFGVSFKRKRR